MKSKTFYATVEVDADYEIDFEDILELIESCTEDELDQIRDIVGDKDNFIEKSVVKSNLDDEQKSELLSAAMKKYTYQELQDRLDIKPYEIF